MIFDGHSDLWIDISSRKTKPGDRIFESAHMSSFREGQVHGGIFVFWADPPNDQNPKPRIDQLLSVAIDELTTSSKALKWIKSSHDYNPADDQRIQIMLGMEGLSHIGRDIDLINYYYDQGVRHASLTWNEENALATGSNGTLTRGLTKEGFQAVDRLESLGMLLDVSHLNAKSFWDLASYASGPFIASHSNARALCNHKRNLTDEQIKVIASSGGLIGINSFRDFVHKDKSKQNIDGIIRHITYMSDLVGCEHIAFGFDYCDYLESDTLSGFTNSNQLSAGADGLNETAESINLLKGLRNEGFTEKEIAMIAHGNYERLLKKILK
ncbi:MAG: dipeptidase [Clostridiales bacterium]|nr:dipeptidase [Clostridiales bacterium]